MQHNTSFHSVVLVVILRLKYSLLHRKARVLLIYPRIFVKVNRLISSCASALSFAYSSPPPPTSTYLFRLHTV